MLKIFLAKKQTYSEVSEKIWGFTLEKNAGMWYDNSMSKDREYLYFKIYRDLITRIKAGKLFPGNKIESEMFLADHYAVSRATVRKALQYLSRMNLIYRVKKGGSFLNGNPKAGQPYRIIPTILPFTENLHYELISGIQVMALSENCFSPVYDSLGNIEHERQILLNLLDLDIDAILLYPCGGIQNLDILYRFLARNIPVFFIDRPLDGIDAPVVSSDNVQGMELAVQHLVNLGHRDIAFFSINQNSIKPEEDRLQGYLETLIKNHISPRQDYILNLENLNSRLILKTQHKQDLFYRQVIRKNMETLFQLSPLPTAVVCLNDFLAINFLKYCLADRHIKIPEQLSLVGFDNVFVSATTTPALTTVKQDFFRIGETAIRCVLNHLNGIPIQKENLIPTELIVRNSTASPYGF